MIVCDLDETAFIFVAETALFWSPIAITDSKSRAEVTYVSTAPST